MSWKTLVVGCASDDVSLAIPGVLKTLARIHRSRVLLTRVLPEPPPSFDLAAPVFPRELYDQFVRSQREQMAALARGWDEPACFAEEIVRVGSPDVELIRTALEHDAGAIVVVERGSRDEPGFSTIAQRLFRKSPVPVLALRNQTEWRTKRVVAAVDLDGVRPGWNEISRAVLQEAAQVARATSAKLVVLHAWILWGEKLVRSRGFVAESELAAQRQRIKTSARNRLAEVMSGLELEDLDVEILLEEGDARYVIPKVGRADHADLMVMGTVGRTGIAGLLIGNTAERVINELGTSVLVLKPPGFESSVVTT